MYALVKVFIYDAVNVKFLILRIFSYDGTAKKS